MSAPESLSIGVSSFSFNQDVIKLRQCLGSTEIESSVEDSDTNGTSENRAHLSLLNDVGLEENRPRSNNRSQSQLTSVYSLDNFSVMTGASSHSRQELYLRDHSIEVALVTNEMYQETLREALIRLDMALVKNLERQNAVQYELNHGRVDRESCSTSKPPKFRIKHWQVLCAPYLKDPDEFPFPENADAKYKDSKSETSPYVVEPQKWTKHEEALLYSSVKSSLKKSLAEPLLQKKEIILNKLTTGDHTELSEDAKLKLHELNSELITKMKLSDKEIMSQCNQEVDWMKISTIEFEGLRSAECCEIMWENTVQPNIYKGAWTKEEDKKLTEITRKHSARNWDTIANELGSKRTAEQCIQRYNAYLNPEIFLKGSWTDEENEALKEVIDELRVGDRIPWGKVSSYLESRHPIAVRRHWFRSLNDEIKRGAWCLEEDVILLLAIKKYGINFTNIFHLLPGRTYSQCRDRYFSTLNMEISFDKWSREEDRRLVSLAKEKGLKWAELAESLPGRTAGMIRQRLKVVLKNIPDAYDRVALDVAVWPYTSSYNNFKAIKRRKKVYDHITTRIKQLKRMPSGHLPYMRNSVKRSRCDPKPAHVIPSSEENTFSDLLNPQHIDFLLAETKNILTKQRNRIEPEAALVKKKKISCPVETALDSLLLPSIVCKAPGRKKSLALSGKEYLEFELCQRSLQKALNFSQEKIEGETIVNKVSMGQDQFSTPSVVTNLKKNKHHVRDDFFSRGIQQTIQKQCLGDINKNVGYSLLPPLRPTVNAFKLMVMDRKRVIELASLMEEVSVIQKLTETPANKKPLCADHSQNEMQNECFTLESETEMVIGEGCTQLEGNGCKMSQIQNCTQCSHLEKLHSSYHKFKNRFLSLFFWPAHMYLVPPPDESIDPSPESFITPKVKRVGRKPKKRGTGTKEVNTAVDSTVDDHPTKKKRRPREFKYKNMAPVRSSARQAKQVC